MSSPVKLTTPLEAGDVERLSVGQAVLLSGTVITARDQAHRYLLERDDCDPLPYDLTGGIVYHCGPILRETDGRWHAVSAGPTTSMRMELYEPRVIERYHLRAIPGKGGMGPETAKALSAANAVYLAAPSGTGALLAKRIAEVTRVWKLDEFGSPEALWELRLEDFPAIVAMDTQGGNLYSSVERSSREALSRLLATG